LIGKNAPRPPGGYSVVRNLSGEATGTRAILYPSITREERATVTRIAQVIVLEG
jgi:hypothetical protein